MTTLSLLTDIGSRLTHARKTLLINPAGGDGDSFGSSFALANYLESQGKPHTVVSHESKLATYSFLPGFQRLHRDAAQLLWDDFDLAIAFDFADPRMCGFFEALTQWRAAGGTLITIDHHQTADAFGDINAVDSTRAASAELVYELFRVNGWPISRDSAICLLTGILSDTGIFAHRNTTPSSFAIAADLVRSGVRMHQILNYTHRNKTLGALRLWGRMLSRLELRESELVVTYVTQEDFRECGVEEEAADGVANFLNALESKAILVLRELGDGMIKGSLRTTRDDIDVASIAKHFGGGGHRRAAGFIAKGSIKEVLEKLQGGA